MRNKVTNPFLVKQFCNFGVKKFDGSTENLRSSYDDRGSERVKDKLSNSIISTFCSKICLSVAIAQLGSALIV